MRPAGCLFLLLLAGCGAELEAGSGSSKSSGGEVLYSAEGVALSQKAQKLWNKNVSKFYENEEQGWTVSSCKSMAAAFESVSRAQGGQFAEAQYMAGLARSRCGDDKAHKNYETALKDNPKLCRARVALGLEALRNEERSKAQAVFEQAIENDPQCTSGYTNLAIMQREAGGKQEAEALQNLRRALAVNSEYLPAFNQMALLQYERGLSGRREAFDLAAVICRQAQIIDPKYAPIYNTWGLIEMAQGDVVEALRLFEAAIQLDPFLFEAQMNFGAVTISFRGYEDGKHAFERAVQLRPSDYDAAIGLGTALRGLGDYEQAQVQYERAQSLKPERPESYFNLGVLYQDYMSGSVEDLKKAKAYFDQFLAHANGKKALASTVKQVSNRCSPQSTSKRGRAKCRPGRLQNIELSIDAISIHG